MKSIIFRLGHIHTMSVKFSNSCDCHSTVSFTPPFDFLIMLDYFHKKKCNKVEYNKKGYSHSQHSLQYRSEASGRTAAACVCLCDKHRTSSQLRSWAMKSDRPGFQFWLCLLWNVEKIINFSYSQYSHLCSGYAKD